MNTPGNEQPEQAEPSCGVSSTFNFTVGAIAFMAATAIMYIAWQWVW